MRSYLLYKLIIDLRDEALLEGLLLEGKSLEKSIVTYLLLSIV